MIKAKELIKKVTQAYHEGWGYIWGMSGQVWTKARQDAATREMTVKYGNRWIGKRVTDCSGLIAWAFKELGGSIYHGSNTMWKSYCSRKGALDNGCRADGQMILPGTAVFLKESDGTRGHVGLYVGDGRVIEAKGTRYGVVMSDLSRWDEWGELKGVDYSDVSGDTPDPDAAVPLSGVCVVDVPNDGTVNVRQAASGSARILTTIREGEEVNVLSDDGTWSLVEYKKTGYIRSRFLRERA